MGFIIGCVVYIGVCEMLDLDDFNKKAWVYAVVGVVGSFLVKAALNG